MSGLFDGGLQRLVIRFNGDVSTHNALFEFCIPKYHSQKFFIDLGILLLGGCECLWSVAKGCPYESVLYPDLSSIHLER